MVGIYKITSPTGKVYIGQSWNLTKRCSSYSRVECTGQPKLYSSLLKHGWTSHTFEVVHQLPIDVSQDVLDRYEILYWQYQVDCGFDILNVKEPGKGGRHSAETKAKISTKQKGIPKSEATKAKMSSWQKGKSKAPEHVAKVAAANRGKSRSLDASRRAVITRRAGNGYNIPQKKLTCQHCGVTGGASNMKRYHLDNCKKYLES